MSEKNSTHKNTLIVLLLCLVVTLLFIGYQNSEISKLKSEREKEIDIRIDSLKSENDKLKKQNDSIYVEIHKKDLEFVFLNNQIDSLRKRRNEREVIFIERVGQIKKMNKHELEEYFKKELEVIFP
jgi:peptidoglycan hydrolase CwlO-like protein